MPIYCDCCEAVIDREDERSRIDDMDLCLDCAQLARPIQFDYQLEAYVRLLKDKGWLHHWEDAATDIVWDDQVDRPSDRQCSFMEERDEEALSLGGGDLAWYWLKQAHLETDLHQVMKQEGWKVVATGGGCEAWTKTINGHVIEVADNSSKELSCLDEDDDCWMFWTDPDGLDIRGESVTYCEAGLQMVKYGIEDIDGTWKRYSDAQVLNPDAADVHLREFLRYVEEYIKSQPPADMETIVVGRPETDHHKLSTGIGNCIEVTSTMMKFWTAAGYDVDFIAGSMWSKDMKNVAYGHFSIDGDTILLIHLHSEKYPAGDVMLIPRNIRHAAWTSTAQRMLHSFETDCNGGFFIDESGW